MVTLSDRDKKVICLKENGWSTWRIADAIGVQSDVTVRNILRRAGRTDLIRSRSKESEMVRSRLLGLLGEGKTLQQAADVLNLTLRSAMDRLRDLQ